MKHSHFKNRRRFLAGLVGGAVATPALLKESYTHAAESPPPFNVRLKPRLYPQANRLDEIDVAGKVVVITGASRGIGLAVGLALQALGAQVIGTSRTPGIYSGYPFPLLALDLADSDSVQQFTATVTSRSEVVSNGGIDILVNNAGRMVIGGIIPVDSQMYFNGIQTGLATLYAGHIAVTSALLPAVAARAAQGYGRILFTTSVQAYSNGGVEPGLSYVHNYNSSKRALLAYANGLRTLLHASGSGIKVSTLSPFSMNTDLMTGNRAIYTQPVDGDGNAIGDPIFQSVIDIARAYVANGISPAFAAQAYRQLITAANPEANVVVGSDMEQHATETSETLALFTSEMRESAFPWVAGPQQL